MRRRFLKRSGTALALAAMIVAVTGSLAFASQAYYSFTIPGNGGVACTTQTETATTIAPYIEVEITGESPSGQTTANFTAANTNCAQLNNAQWQVATLGAGNVSIYVDDTQGQSIKLMGGTGLAQPQSTVSGYWNF